MSNKKLFLTKNRQKEAWCGMWVKFLLFFMLTLGLSACEKSNKISYQAYVEGENIYLSSPNPGILVKLFVTRGQEIKLGHAIFNLDPKPEIFLAEQAKADLEQARHLLQDLINPKRQPEIAAIEAQIEQVDAQINLNALRFHRSTELYAKSSIDKDSVDAALANLQVQKKLRAQFIANLALANLGGREEAIKGQAKQVVAMEEKYQQALWNLAQKSKFSPATGLIFDTYFREGEYVGANQSVASLLTAENIYINFFVPATVLVELRLNQRVELLAFGEKRSTSGVIAYISPEAEYLPPLVYSRENQDKLVFRIRVKPQDPWAYKPGQPVTVSI